MTKLEKTVEALRRCIPAAEFEKAMAEVEATEAESAAPAVERLIRKTLTEIGTPDHLNGHRYLVTALGLVVENPEVLYAGTIKLYTDVAAVHKTTPYRVERSIRHAVETTWDRIDWDLSAAYFGNTVSPLKGKPTNSEFMARMGAVIRQKLKENEL